MRHGRSDGPEPGCVIQTASRPGDRLNRIDRRILGPVLARADIEVVPQTPGSWTKRIVKAPLAVPGAIQPNSAARQRFGRACRPDRAVAFSVPDPGRTSKRTCL